MPDAEAIRRRFDRIPEEPKTAEDHPWIAAALLFVFVFFFISVLSTFLNSSAQYQKELAAAEAQETQEKGEDGIPAHFLLRFALSTFLILIISAIQV